MILQTLDIKDNCKGIFHNGEFIFDNFHYLLDDYSVAWKHSTMLDDEKFKYLFLYEKSEDLSRYATHPSAYRRYKDKMHAHKKAALTAKVDLSEQCFFDVLPEHQLTKWFFLRDTALQRLHNTKQQESDYDILHKAHVLTTEINNQDIIFQDNLGRVSYDIFGSATGRLTTKKGSVPVLTLKKNQRALLRPRNDAYVEFDLNAAEIRTLLALSNKKQPAGDIHKWASEVVYENKYTREQTKIKLFSWLYNFSALDTQLDKFFSRQIFRDFFDSGKQVLRTPFGRNLAVDERKAQNYLLQSTTSDIVIQNAYKIMKMLKGKKSNVAFTLHDSIIVDMSREDSTMIKQIKQQFEETPWGDFVSTCKIGKNFADLKGIQI